MRATIRTILIVILTLALIPLLSKAYVADFPHACEQVKYGQRIAKSGETTATAYNSLPEQTDDTPWITAAGTRCREGVVASNFLPMGTRLFIEGFGEQVFVVEDRMNRRYKDRIDLWFREYDDAIQFGRRKIRYFIIDA